MDFTISPDDHEILRTFRDFLQCEVTPLEDRYCETQYATDRKAFGKPIGRYQAVQSILADSALEVHAARLMTL